MKKIDNNLAIFIYLLISIVNSFAWSVAIKIDYLNLKYYSYSFIVLSVVGIILIIYNKIKTKTKTNIIDILLIFLIILGIISTIFASNISVSLFGVINRYEGLFSLIYYYILLYISTLLKDDKKKEEILIGILIIGVIQAFIGFHQCFLENTRVIGTFGHFNFFGTFILLNLSLVLGLFVFKKKNIFLNYILILLFFFELLTCNTLSSLVGFIFINIFLICYFIYLIIKRKKLHIDLESIIKKYIYVISGLIIISTITIYLDKTTLFDDLIQTKNEVSTSIKDKKLDDNMGTNRMYIWKKTMKIVPENIINGVGIDCFYYAFDGKNLLSTDRRYAYDKAHNEYLQILITEGLPAVLVYLILLIIIFLNTFNKILKEPNYLYISIFLTALGYAVQAFFNISVIRVAPFYYILLGLMFTRSNKGINFKKFKKSKIN